MRMFIFTELNRIFLKATRFKPLVHINNLVGFLELIFFFWGKRTKILVLDLMPAHSQFSKLLLKDWDRIDIMLIKTYKKQNDEISFQNEVHISDFRLLHKFKADYVISFASHLKRSMLPKNSSIIHLPHSLVSLHGVYTKQAFECVDHLIACGPHHIVEFGNLSQQLGWIGKKIYEGGYLKVDYLKSLKASKIAFYLDKTVLLAPSWGQNNLLKYAGARIIKELLLDNWKVIVRPHPLIFKTDPEVLREFNEIEAKNPEDLVIEGESPNLLSLLKADIMISDWSGVAYEFAFATGRPVLFVNRPYKQVTPDIEDYPRVELPLMEIEAREKVGEICYEENFVELLNKLFNERDFWSKKIELTRKEYLFNFEKSSSVIINQLERIITNHK